MSKPILFSGPMVQAILDGKKTQTRRVIRPQPYCSSEMVTRGAYFDAYNGVPQWNWWTEDGRLCNGQTIVDCPFGTIGSKLWVKETWRVYDKYDDIKPTELPDNIPVEYKFPPTKGAYIPGHDGRWRPSIFMQKRFSRIKLEITGLRAERLQDISEDDIWSEGLDKDAYDEWLDDAMSVGVPNGVGVSYTKPRDLFRELWDGINYERAPWESNPWVWKIEFRRVR